MVNYSGWLYAGATSVLHDVFLLNIMIKAKIDVEPA
jgi:hypothetical protein